MDSQLVIRRVLCGAYGENAYLAYLSGRQDALLIDPGDDLQALQDALRQSGKKLAAILLTHGHFDHAIAAGELSRLFGAPVYAHRADLNMIEDVRLNMFDPAAAALSAPSDVNAQAYPVEDDGEFSICGLSLQLLHTPGHTPGSVCLYAHEHAALFSGDTLFAAAFGRTDLPGGSPLQMRRSLARLLRLPDEINVYPGHQQPTTIARERRFYGF